LWCLCVVSMDVGTILPLGADFIFAVRKRPVLDLAALVVC
jgi:hypothetical protein